ncbi:flagellar hook-length control protein FliK [Terrarubrum flagellatum]|uniref:flagellar hook-length control protein FliK n=1 Tax=Terrirubrum flagellatum TaxID=2895980 RepID=UPI003144EE30
MPVTSLPPKAPSASHAAASAKAKPVEARQDDDAPAGSDFASQLDDAAANGADPATGAPAKANAAKTNSAPVKSAKSADPDQDASAIKAAETEQVALSTADAPSTATPAAKVSAVKAPPATSDVMAAYEQLQADETAESDVPPAPTPTALPPPDPAVIKVVAAQTGSVGDTPKADETNSRTDASATSDNASTATATQQLPPDLTAIAAALASAQGAPATQAQAPAPDADNAPVEDATSAPAVAIAALTLRATPQGKPDAEDAEKAASTANATDADDGADAEVDAKTAVAQPPAIPDPAAGKHSAKHAVTADGSASPLTSTTAANDTTTAPQTPTVPTADQPSAPVARAAKASLEAIAGASRVSTTDDASRISRAADGVISTFGDLTTNALAAQTPTATTSHPPISAPDAAQTATSAVPVQMAPLVIGMQALEGAREFQIKLDPEHLGRVDVKLKIADNGRVEASLVVDKVETLALLQRDARTLERAFDQAGLTSDSDSLSFSLRQDMSGQQQNNDQREASRAAPWSQIQIDAPTDIAPLRQYYSATARSGVDIRV